MSLPISFWPYVVNLRAIDSETVKGVLPLLLTRDSSADFQKPETGAGIVKNLGSS